MAISIDVAGSADIPDILASTDALVAVHAGSYDAAVTVILDLDELPAQ